jgi:hypothetical protein
VTWGAVDIGAPLSKRTFYLTLIPADLSTGDVLEHVQNIRPDTEA